jgi:hypothetical protein
MLDKIRKGLVLKLVEIIIPWRDTEVGNREINESFKLQHITKNSLPDVRIRKETRYEGAIFRWK